VTRENFASIKKLYRQENTNMNSESPQSSVHFPTEQLIECTIQVTMNKCKDFQALLQSWRKALSLLSVRLFFIHLEQ